jgi:hypothetical protein
MQPFAVYARICQKGRLKAHVIRMLHFMTNFNFLEFS